MNRTPRPRSHRRRAGRFLGGLPEPRSDSPVPPSGSSSCAAKRRRYGSCGFSRCSPSPFRYLYSALRRPRATPAGAARWSPWEAPALLALTFASFALRFYRITEVPDHVDNDVALMGVQTLRMMQNHDLRWFGLAASDHLLATHEIQALGLRLFRNHHFGLVMMSVLAGTLTVPVLYVLARGGVLAARRARSRPSSSRRATPTFTSAGSSSGRRRRSFSVFHSPICSAPFARAVPSTGPRAASRWGSLS